MLRRFSKGEAAIRFGWELTLPRLTPGGSEGNHRHLSRDGATAGLGFGYSLCCERPAPTPGRRKPPEGGRRRPPVRRLHCLTPRRSQERVRTRPGRFGPVRVEHPSRSVCRARNAL